MSAKSCGWFLIFSTKILKFSQSTSSSKSFVFDLAMKARSRVLSWSRVVLVDWDTTRLNISFLLVHWFEVVSCTGRLLLKCVFRTKPGWLFTCWLQQRGQLWLCYLVVFLGTNDVFNIRSLFGCWQNTFSVGTLTKFLRMQFRCVNVDERWEDLVLNICLSWGFPYIRVAEVAGEHGWTRTKILSPNICYFVQN